MTAENDSAQGSGASAPQEYPTAMATRIASHFQLTAPIEAYDFAEKGNINLHTFLIVAGPRGDQREYLLQRINEQVFTQPRNVMAAMIACIEAQNRTLAARPMATDEPWEAITLVPTHDGRLYYEEDDQGSPACWRLMVRIPDTKSYKSLGQVGEVSEGLRVSEEVGRGLAVFNDLTAGMETAGLASPLPGYRDTRLYYNQLLSVLAGSRTLAQAEKYLPVDPVVRESTQNHFILHLSDEEYRRRMEDPELQPFIKLAREQEGFAMTLLRAMDEGTIRNVAIHGDTKIENFLFDANTGKVKALIDLDTIMPHTWLVDWGDMVRSLVNVAGEKETDMSRVGVDMDVFRAVTRGFVSHAHAVTEAEIALMYDAIEILALELGVRFLSDYLRGDSYFKLGPSDPPELNKTRAMVQLTLFQRLRDNAAAAKACISEYGKSN